MSSPFRKPALALLALAFCGVQEPVLAQYGGPSILSRGGNQPGRRGRAPINFTAYFGAGSRYETGLIIPSRTIDGGTVPVNDDLGYTVEGGLYGGHDWRRQSVGLDYRGDYRWQRTQKQFDGTNHVLSFDYVFRPQRRLQIALRESGGTTNRALGSFAAPTFADTTRQGIPLAELFDVRTYFAQSGVAAYWTKSPRLQITLQADTFFVKREALSLINSQGYDARASAMYRFSRSLSFGPEYQYYKFDFPRAYSGTEAHGPGIRFRQTIGRRIIINGLGGVLVLKSFGTEFVQLSPEVAQILGRPTTVASFVRDTWSPNAELQATIQQSRGAFQAAYNTGVGSGNGVYLTTTRTSLNGGYSYTGVKRTSMGVSGGWTRTSSASVKLPPFSSWQTGVGASYKLSDGLNLLGQIDYRSFGGLNIASRNGIAVSITLSYSTSHLPISIW